VQATSEHKPVLIYLHAHIGVSPDTTEFLRILASFRESGKISGYSSNFPFYYYRVEPLYLSQIKSITRQRDVAKYSQLYGNEQLANLSDDVYGNYINYEQRIIARLSTNFTRL
jgi:hypothetical protein